MIEKLFNYYQKEYKVEWLPNGDVDIYGKNIKQEEHIGFVIYFNKNNEEYAITIDSEMIFILKKKKRLFANKAYWNEINHIHLDKYDDEKVIQLIDSYLK